MRKTLLAALLLFAGCERRLAVLDAPTCVSVERHSELAFRGVYATDVLFVVSDAPSMADEQASLARELPAMVRAMISGDLALGREYLNEPLRDLHIGVVSADLGMDGSAQTLAGCTAAGDGAVLSRGQHGAGCATSYPAFLQYEVPNVQEHPLIEPPSPALADALVNDTACLTGLGSGGCGVVQPLEAALRALSNPAEPTRVGDAASPGFVRSDPKRGSSLVYVVLVSDGDDCSVANPDLFASSDTLDDPRASCARHGELLQSVERYVAGLRSLRPDSAYPVMLSAITGVPEDLIEEEPPDLHHNAARAKYFDAILADPRMQWSQRADSSLQPACENAHASATPARRIVETVRDLGGGGNLTSICSESWAHALLPLFFALETSLGSVCPTDRPVRRSDGITQCEVHWLLPSPDHNPGDAPTRCDELDFLEEPESDNSRPDGRRDCKVHQLAVTGLPEAPELEPGNGWFFDDFSPSGVCRECAATGPTCNQIFFVPSLPPPGVGVTFDCFDTHEILPEPDGISPIEDRAQLFDACDASDPHACERRLTDPRGGELRDGIDRRLVCDPERMQCAPPCAHEACPSGWSCNEQDFCEAAECRVPG